MPSQLPVVPVRERVDDGSDTSGDDEDETRVENAGLDDLRYKAAGEVQTQKQSKAKRNLDFGMDYLINAEKRAGLNCRRKVFNVCFDNNDIVESDHLCCDSSQSLGCKRCCVSQPSICCDIHNPDHFDFLDTNVSKPPPLPQRSRLPKFQMTGSDFTLRTTLNNWREQKAISVYGWAHLNDFGATIIMPNAILDRIIDSAHHRKIQTVQDLKRETGWTDAEKFGDDVVVIVRAHAPTPFATNPLRPLTAVPHPIGGSSTRKNKCSACRQEGHNGNVISHFFMDT
ncbi:hypothetical protein C8R48DRAFT_619786 [Suillus tomentosus]|nr:hypothetical protein C8R48DRAFT_619786 [Suillus tomentosus]